MTPARAIRVAVLASTLLLVSAGCSSSTPESTPTSSTTATAETSFDPETQAQFQQVLDGIVTEFGAPGVQAGVWTEDAQWVGTSGTAQMGTTRTIGPDDHTRIGSITKTMTATVILQLIDEGRLSFDDVIEAYVPGMPNGDTATMQNLLEMQTGIPSYTGSDTDVLTKYSADPTAPFTSQELVNSVKKLPPMFKPGEQFFYSNTNYVLLGMVIEKVTGTSIADNFQQRLFTPLGMNQSSVPGTSTELPEPYLSGISDQTDPVGEVKNATNWNPSFANTAGEVISTLDDVHKWGLALGTGEGILNPQTQQMRVESVNQTVPPNTPERSYGMGLVNTAGWLGHTGEIPGYSTVVNYQPESGTTIVVMVNSDIPGGTKKNPVAPNVATFQQLATIVAAG